MFQKAEAVSKSRQHVNASDKLVEQKNIGMTLRCCIRMNLRREPSIASEKLGGQKILILTEYITLDAFKIATVLEAASKAVI